MFVLKNAWRSVTRNKGRNILIIIIVAIIAAATTIGLSIRQAADEARSSGLDNTTVTAQISVDRSKLISQAQSDSSSDGEPDFDGMREALEGTELSLADYEQYDSADYGVKSSYYSETTSVAKTDDFQPVSTSTSDTDSDADSSATDSGTDSEQGEGQQGGAGGGQDPGFGETQAAQGDFSLVGFSSDDAVAAAGGGSFTMQSGEVFGYDSDSDGSVIISQALADFNNLSVGDTVSVAGVSDSSATYELTVVGIYKNTTDNTGQMGGPMNSTASDPDNAIYTSVSTLKSLGLDSDADSDDAATLSYTYVFANKTDYETFETTVKEAGLSDDYTVSSADVDAYESSLVPLDNLAQFALTLLLIVLGVGAVVLVALNVFNVRERKYEVGVLTAIGIRKSKVATQFVFELFIVTMIGIALGVAAGAATSIPISNQLLASQVSAQESEQSSQQAQFGRGMQGGGDAAGEESDSGSESDSAQQEPQNMQGGPGEAFSGFGQNAVDYIDTVNATVNLRVIGQMVAIGILLTVFSSLVAIVFVMRYEPLQILADRS